MLLAFSALIVLALGPDTPEQTVDFLVSGYEAHQSKIKNIQGTLVASGIKGGRATAEATVTYWIEGDRGGFSQRFLARPFLGVGADVVFDAKWEQVLRYTNKAGKGGPANST